MPRLIIVDCMVNVVYVTIATFITSPWTIVGEQDNWCDQIHFEKLPVTK